MSNHENSLILEDSPVSMKAEKVWLYQMLRDRGAQND